MNGMQNKQEQYTMKSIFSDKKSFRENRKYRRKGKIHFLQQNI